MYTRNDLQETIGDNDNQLIDVTFTDGETYSVPYSVMTEEEIKFITENWDMTSAEEDEADDILVKYVNTGEAIKHEKQLLGHFTKDGEIFYTEY